MTEPDKFRIPYPTNDQFWRARQAMERPADLAERENSSSSGLKQDNVGL